MTRNVVRFAQTLDAVSMLTRNYKPCPQAWNRVDQYDPLADTSEVLFQGLSLSKVFKKKTKTGVKIALLDVDGNPHTSAPPSEQDASEDEDEDDVDPSGEDETETIRHEGFGASPQKMLKIQKTTSSSYSSSSSSSSGSG